MTDPDTWLLAIPSLSSLAMLYSVLLVWRFAKRGPSWSLVRRQGLVAVVFFLLAVVQLGVAWLRDWPWPTLVNAGLAVLAGATWATATRTAARTMAMLDALAAIERRAQGMRDN